MVAADAIRPGVMHPLGASWDGRGVNFAIFSEHGTAVQLCLFDDSGREARIDVPWCTAHVWHVYVDGLGPGQRYGWRVDGPYAPRAGDRFNAHKLLVDPYARALDGTLDVKGPVYAYPRDRGFDDLEFDARDDAHAKPKAIVVDDAFDWSGDRAPRVPWDDTILYELHVKGFTKQHPLVPVAQQGTFLGLASEAAIGHLKSLGVTTLELMPVHAHADEPAVVARGLINYWGYSTLAFFAPDARFATRGGDAVREFKAMIKRLHAAGIEVILDVVYNHTCEGGELGPSASLRGIDNRVYYRIRTDDPRQYLDFTGCGNTLNALHPQVVKLIADSLRYWVSEMHVDGFRFDLAPALARGPTGEFDPLAALLSIMHQDPTLSAVKLIAEPWDLGAGGYQVGNFPVLWSEWNGRYRDTVRAFWNGRANVVADLGYRLTGSSDLFGDDGRRARASINFITTHDGFTLRDLVSYEKKHNEANGEDNKDGLDDNASQNCGIEGETRDEGVLSRRRTLARSLMTTLFLSQGVPMLAMGDELWRTQGGNNNPYCHDSALTWVDWKDDEAARAMLECVQALARLRRDHPVFRRHDFLRGTRRPGGRAKDIVWLRRDGVEMSVDDWATPDRAAIAFRLDGDGIATSPGTLAHDQSFIVMLNGDREPLVFTLPPAALGGPWRVAVDTREKRSIGNVAPGSSTLVLEPSSVVVWIEV